MHSGRFFKNNNAFVVVLSHKSVFAEKASRSTLSGSIGFGSQVRKKKQDSRHGYYKRARSSKNACVMNDMTCSSELAKRLNPPYTITLLLDTYASCERYHKLERI